ncbi:MAG: 30S ribosomal protein S1 [Thermodesulfobacteriota bacterium]
MIGKEENNRAVDEPRSEFEELFEAGMKEPKEGDTVKGTVIQISHDIVVVDIGYKSEGQVSIREFLDSEGKPTVKVGDEISVFIEKREGEDGMVVLSKLRADQMKVWDSLIEAHDKEENVTGTVTQRVKGGFYVDLNGITAFLPGSQAGLKPVRDPDKLIGETHQFRVLKYNRRKSNVIVSRRVLLEKEREKLREKTLATLEEGSIVEGVVKNITDYGAFIDLGGIDGLVHLTDMSWGKVSHPSQVLSIGDTVKVKVLRFNREDNKISLGIKQTKADPWLTAAEKYTIGSRVTGRVVNLTDYGAFVELEQGLEGLIHISEMSWTKLKHPSQKVKVDETVEVQILDLDVGNRRISLGLKQVEPNPWEEAESKYPKGTRIKGVVKNITDFGIFVGIEEGIDGLVHISDLSWRKVKHPSEIFTKGQEVEAVVLNIDSAQKRFSLSTRLVEKNPWEGVQDRYHPGMIVDGVITSIADFGAFVEIEEGLEGLIHISELSRGKAKGSDLKPGDTVEVEVLNVDPEDCKIGLSIRAVKKTAEEAAGAEGADAAGPADTTEKSGPGEAAAGEAPEEGVEAAEATEPQPSGAEEKAEGEEPAADTEAAPESGETAPEPPATEAGEEQKD